MNIIEYLNQLCQMLYQYKSYDKSQKTFCLKKVISGPNKIKLSKHVNVSVSHGKQN